VRQDSLCQPGSPWENGYVEKFISKLRDELLDMEVINSWNKLRC